MGCPRRQTAAHFGLQTVYIPGMHTWGQERKDTGRNGWRSQVVMQPNNGHLWSACPDPGPTSSLKEHVPQRTTEELEEKLSPAKRKSGEAGRLLPDMWWALVGKRYWDLSSVDKTRNNWWISAHGWEDFTSTVRCRENSLKNWDVSVRISRRCKTKSAYGANPRDNIKFPALRFSDSKSQSNVHNTKLSLMHHS